MIGGEELKIDPAKMAAIIKGPTPTNVTEVLRFVGETKYLWKFKESFIVVDAPLHSITTSGKSFQWGKNKHKSF